jgi:hypothetical protein
MELTHQLEEIHELLYKLFETLVNEKDNFLQLIAKRDGVNTPIEFYYKLLIDAVLKHEEMLDYFPVLAKPIIAYLEGKPVDYEALSYFIVFLASSN